LVMKLKGMIRSLFQRVIPDKSQDEEEYDENWNQYERWRSESNKFQIKIRLSAAWPIPGLLWMKACVPQMTEILTRQDRQKKLKLCRCCR